MTNLNTYIDFVGSINIPNLEKDIQGFETVYNTPYQKEILVKLFGFDLYTTFEAGLLEDPILQKWTDLKNGSTYLVNEIKKENPGLKKLVANYVYCKWLTINYEQLTGLGSINSNSENATIISPENKIVNAWNEMIKLYYQVYDFMYNNQTDYPNCDTEELRILTYGF